MSVARDNLKKEEKEKITIERENLKSEVRDLKKQIKK